MISSGFRSSKDASLNSFPMLHRSSRFLRPEIRLRRFPELYIHIKYPINFLCLVFSFFLPQSTLLHLLTLPRPISMHMQICSVTWLLSGTFIVSLFPSKYNSHNDFRSQKLLSALFLHTPRKPWSISYGRYNRSAD